MPQKLEIRCKVHTLFQAEIGANSLTYAVADPGFPRGGCATLRGREHTRIPKTTVQRRL